MHEAWKGYKFKLHKYFKEIGGEEDPIKAKEKGHEEVSKEDWEYLCNYWTNPKYLVMQIYIFLVIIMLWKYSLFLSRISPSKEKARKNAEAREKRRYKSRNG